MKWRECYRTELSFGVTSQFLRLLFFLALILPEKGISQEKRNTNFLSAAYGVTNASRFGSFVDGTGPYVSLGYERATKKNWLYWNARISASFAEGHHENWSSFEENGWGINMDAELNPRWTWKKCIYGFTGGFSTRYFREEYISEWSGSERAGGWFSDTINSGLTVGFNWGLHAGYHISNKIVLGAKYNWHMLGFDAWSNRALAFTFNHSIGK